MLFALEWMKNIWGIMVSAIRTFTEELDLFSVSAGISGFWPVLIFCLAVGLTLCFLGFRYHKFVNGIVGGMLLGCLGWYIGQTINARQMSISAVYAIILAITGFFVFYLCYFLNVFVGSGFLFLAVLAGAELREYGFLLAVVLAVIYCVLYIKYKLAMTAVTGAALLGLAVFNRSPFTAAVLFCVCIASGIYVQRMLRRRCEKQRAFSMQAQLEKYPYGPGLVYGWQDPTLSNTSKKMDKLT